MLDFRNWTFSSPNLCVRAIMPPNSKFRLNRTRWSRVIAKKMIFNMASVRHLEFGNFWFCCHVSVAWDKIYVCKLNFVKFGRFAVEILRYNDFQNGGRRPCWIFEIWHFHHLTFVCVRLRLLIPNFVLVGQYGAESDNMEPTMIFNMASVRHLEFRNFWIFVTIPSPCSIFASAYQISSNSDDSRLRYGDIMIFKMAAVRHLGFSKFDVFIT